MVFASDVVVGAFLFYLPYAAGKYFAPAASTTVLAPFVSSMWNMTLADLSKNITLLPQASVLAGYTGGAALSSSSSSSSSSFFITLDSTLLSEAIVGFLFALFSIFAWRIFTNVNAPVNVRRIPTEPRKSRMQKAEDFPPPFPNGWFLVEHSHRLDKGQVKEVQAFGLVLALFRGMDGKAAVVDGICPHLGANLGATGVVSGNCLKCIFHGWEFDENGKCVKIHGTDTIPTNAAVKKYPTREKNGCIFMYYDIDGNDPTWEVETFDPIDKGQWYLAGETYNIVHAHINEIPENGSDAAHLNVLHQPFVVSQLQPVFDHLWTCSWEVDKDKPYSSKICLTQSMNLGGWPLPFGTVDAKITQVGPGLVILTLDTIFGTLITYETLLPTRCTSQIARHVTFASPGVPRIVGKFVMWALEEQFNRDVPIWESKKFLPKPMISKADGPILNYRRWMSQFYSPSSVSFPDALAKEYMLDW